MSENSHWYSDSGFWQFAVAFVALILTQLPPIKYWFRKGRVSVQVWEHAGLLTELGLPIVHAHVSIINKGGRDIQVDRMSITVSRDEHTRKLLGVGYFEKSTDSSPTLLTPFTLASGEEWRRTVNFVYRTNRDDRSQVNDLTILLTDNIAANRQARGAPPNKLVEGESQVVDPLVAIFDRNFFWNAGEYSMELEIETNIGSTKRRVSFPLFETESNDLKGNRGQVKYGFFIGPALKTILVMLKPVE